MHKKCSVCEETTAQYLIKDTTDYYCEECALQCFGDLGLLISVEEQARKLKEMIDTSITQDPSSLKDQDNEEEREEKE
ncbi:hypothetical protein HYY69_07030 [Candidatus Woesearchaeota archaeon]|nr:hypothetical protein [Candidatus Woesearchaeota archaeon]